MTTWLRVREQIHSNYLGQHVASGYMTASHVIDQLSAQLAARGHAAAPARAIASLASMVERESIVLAYIDGFWLTFWFSVFGILFVSLIGTPPSVRFVPVPFSEWLGTRRSISVNSAL